jgi:hypothetical protein
MKTSVRNGGCWYCRDDSGPMIFSFEVDAWLHLECIKAYDKKLKNVPEHQMIKNELKESWLKKLWRRLHGKF